VDQQDFDVVARSMGQVIGETNAQVIALFRALFSTLMLRGQLSEDDVRALIETAAAQLGPDTSRAIIAGLQPSSDKPMH
jgi:hypothetical protein